MKRNKILYTIWIFLVILTGLSSRSQSLLLPAIVKEYAGDTLWALVVYLSVGFLLPHLAISRVAIITALFCLAIEVSQLYHAPWIDQIRHMRLGELVLGFGFLWSDLFCYCVGISIGMLLEWYGKRYLILRLTKKTLS